MTEDARSGTRGPAEPARPAGEESAWRLAAIFESSEDAIVGLDLEGRITDWNPAAERLFGYPAERILGRSLDVLMPADRVDDWRRILDRVTRGERVEHFETRRRTRDGRILDVSLTVSPVRDREGRIVGAAKIVRDVTAQRAARREAERMRDLFLGAVSHDLRNPLNTISVSVHTLRLRATEADQKVLARIGNGVERMSRMIDQLLDFTAARLADGFRVERRRTDLAALCRRVADEFEGPYPGRVFVTEEGDVTGSWDGDRLEQALSNFVSNALRYGAPDAPVKVRARSCGSTVSVEVTNRGEPIPEALFESIFEPFRRGSPDEPRGPRGLGLGLYIARGIARAHGGDIAVRSAPDEGTTFTMTLPRDAG